MSENSLGYLPRIPTATWVCARAEEVGVIVDGNDRRFWQCLLIDCRSSSRRVPIFVSVNIFDRLLAPIS